MDAGLLNAIVFFAGIVVLSSVLTGIATVTARRLRLYAHPVERSSHAVPTPQVGGVGICLSLGSALFLIPVGFLGQESFGFFGFQSRFAAYPLVLDPRWALLSYVALGMVLGLIDDVRHLNALTKLAGLIVVAAVPFLVEIGLGGVERDPTGAQPHPWAFWLACAIAFGWIVFFANAFNFMDGVNGQSGVFALNAFFWWAAMLAVRHGSALLSSGPERELLLILIAGGGAALGFLFWNFPRALTFMGDSGALPLGAALGFLVVALGGFSVSEAVIYALPLSVFVYDVVFTLARRALRGENLLQAHRSHLYQRLLIATGWTHARLLAFHLPFYLLTGFAAWFCAAMTVEVGRGETLASYLGFSQNVLLFAWILFVALVLAAYTVAVLQYEAKSDQEKPEPQA